MQNPRPRKYASDAERQAAFRSRASMLEFRADEKTAEKLTEIATTLDISRSDLLLSMVKFALTNHQWARFGLTHKTLPRYEENPIMATKKFSPAQIAAQKLFAERARAGTLGKGTKRKVNPQAMIGREMNPSNVDNWIVSRDRVQTIITNLDTNRMKLQAAKNYFSAYGVDIPGATKSAFIKNLGKMLVEKENSNRKTNPDKAKPRAYVKRVSQATGAPPSKRLVTRRKKALTAPAGYFPNPKAAKKPLTLQERSKKFKIELGFDKFKTFKKVVGYYPSDSSPDYELVALFQTQREAVSAGRTYAENYPKFRWFVKDL